MKFLRWELTANRTAVAVSTGYIIFQLKRLQSQSGLGYFPVKRPDFQALVVPISQNRKFLFPNTCIGWDNKVYVPQELHVDHENHLQ
jgi:hypothetical protein